MVFYNNCTPPVINEFPLSDLFTQEERRHGAVVLHIIGCIYILYALAIVCDVYFVPAIEKLSSALKLPPDVAGATFMAAATSSPELFTNLIGTFITKDDIGVGTIVGSAVFNLLAVAACCGLAAKKATQMEWWPLTRDCLFYCVSVVLLLVFIWDRKIFWWESLVFVLLYVIYITMTVFNERLRSVVEPWIEFQCRKYCCCKNSEVQESIEGEEESLLQAFEERTWTPGEGTPNSNLKIGKSEIENKGFCNNEGNIVEEITFQQPSVNANSKAEIDEEENSEEYFLLTPPFKNGVKDSLIWLINWPIMVCFIFSIPDCRKEKLERYYPVSFIICIIWIGGLTYIVTFLMTVIGFTWGLPDSIMGLTFLAWGTSVPEAVSSVIVTRKGYGSMGMSNSIGSNTFDILLCLGLPWLIQGARKSEHFVAIRSAGIEYSVLILLSSLVVMYSIFLCSGFRLGKVIAVISLSMYVVFLVISSLFELNVFFLVNLPTCQIT